MKKIPLSLFSIIILGIFAAVFAFVVPQGEHLISEQGDTLLGFIVGILVASALLFDIKKFSSAYRSYIADNPQGYWFKRKWYGWGWTPVTWQGWLITIIYIGAIILSALTLDKNSPTKEVAFTFILPILLLTTSFIFIAYKKGEKPRWQWGPEEKE